MMKSVYKVAVAAWAVTLCLLVSAPVSGQVLSYDGFGDGYTAGAAAGQSYQGTGYTAAGAWNNNDFADGGLSHPTLLTTPGVRVVRTTDDMEGIMDTSAGGPFGAAGLVGSNGHIGGEEVSGTLYYSFLGREIDGNGDGWGGFNLFDDDGDEQFGVGNGGGPDDYVVFHNDSGEPAIGTPPTPIDDSTRFFVVKAEYNGGAKDTFTAWLDPDPSLSEAGQAADISVTAGSQDDDDNDGFQMFRMRGDGATGNWEFDEVRFGTTWESVTPVVPEPSTALLAMIGLASAGLLARRRR